MNNIKKIKTEYFNYYCSIEAYTKFNGIVDIANNETIKIMLKHQNDWSYEFQKKYFFKLDKNITINQYIDCIIAITTSSKNYEQLYRLVNIIIKDITNKKYEDDYLIDFFYKIILLDMPFLSNFDKKILNLFDYLKQQKLINELNKLLLDTRTIILKDNNKDYLFFKNKVLKIIKKFK